MSRELLEYAGDTARTDILQKGAEKRTLLTVVMPVYNEVGTVVHVIDRVLGLDLDVELVVVDGQLQDRGRGRSHRRRTGGG